MTTLNEFIELVMAELPDKTKASFDLVVTPTTVMKRKLKRTELRVAANWSGGNRIKFTLTKLPKEVK